VSRSRAALLAAIACASALAAAPALAAGPTGDPATIATYRAVVAATNAKGVVVVTQSGYMSLSARASRPATFTWTYGQGHVAAGFRAATETITLAQAKGRVVWLADYVVPAACSAANPCTANGAMPPIELLVTPHAAFAGVVTGAHAAVACFRREPFTSVPYRAGGPWWSVFGDFRPEVTRGNQILVTLTYSWGNGRHVTELDSIRATPGLFAASAIHVARGAAAGQPAFSIAQSDAYPAVVPAAPKVSLCR